MQAKARKLTALVAAAVATLSAGSALAATEAQKRAAIDNGLAWLASSQQGNGRWIYDNSYGDTAATSAALLAFLEEKPNWGANAAAYQAVVDNGLNYVFSQATNYPFVQPAADVNGNGLGVKFVPGGNEGRDTYVTGLVLPAIVATGTPNAIVANGSQAGRTYGAVVQDVVDYFAHGQNDAGYATGGWRYYANSGDADNSTAQWPPVGMLYAQSFGATVPGFVKTQLQTWIDYIQNANGGSGYDAPWNLVNEAKTGGLLVEMAFAGYNGYAADAVGSNEALSYLNGTWQQMANNTWDGNFNHPYAMWSIYKGLESTIGVDADTSIINNLLSANCGGNVDNPNHGCNWYEDYSEWLVNNQNGDGSWTGYSSWNNVLATPWYINILAATEIPDNHAPEPGTLALLAAGLFGIGPLARRRLTRS